MQDQKQGAPRVAPDNLITEHDIARYWRYLAIPSLMIIAVLALTHGTLLTGVAKYLIAALFFFALAFLVRNIFHGSRRDTMVTTIMAAVVVGFAIAILRMVLAFSFYLVFDMLVEPAQLIVLGAVVAWGTTTLLPQVSLPHIALHRAHSQS